jgi:hypothetical protein
MSEKENFKCFVTLKTKYKYSIIGIKLLKIVFNFSKVLDDSNKRKNNKGYNG